MRVVVTGGAGFIGSHLCRSLLARGDEVVAIDNLVTGAKANIESLLDDARFSFVEHDVSTFTDVEGDVDAILHFASPASPVDYLELPIQTLKVGSLGTHNLLGMAKAKGARFLLASTSEVYGDPQVHPQREDYWGHVNPVGPRGVYDEAKRFAEAMTMAYHRYHGVDVRIVRIFNSILADEQVLYDDGHELRREPVAALAARIGRRAALDGYRVPAFDGDGTIASCEAIALEGHATMQRCFEVTTRYGRSIRVTGDHSLFVEGPGGRAQARPVNDLQVGDRVAIAARVEVPVRDRTSIDMAAVWDAAGRDPWDLEVCAEGLGDVAWEHRESLFAAFRQHREKAEPTRNAIWGLVRSCRTHDRMPLGALRKLGLSAPEGAAVRIRGNGKRATLPARIDVTDELLWLLGLYVAEGGRYERDRKSAFVHLSCDDDVLDRASKVIVRDLGLHVVRAGATKARSSAAFIHSQLLIMLLDHLGFAPGAKRVPGWVLGLPLQRLGWFIEGYREGDGVHSGDKFDDGVRHEWSTTSDDLKDDLLVAFARFGLVASVGRYETTFRQGTGDRRYPFWRLTLCNVSPWSPLDWHRGVEQKLQSRRTGDLVWASVTSVTEVPATDLVYDFSVPGRENFWAGSGVMAHNTYGERMRPNDGRVVSNFLMQALAGEDITVYGDGNQTRSFCYVEDEVRGILALLDGDVVGPVNIGNPNEFTILQLAEQVIDVTGSTSKIVHRPLPVDDPMQRKPDITLARTKLGWEPKVQLREGLERTAPWFERFVKARRG